LKAICILSHPLADTNNSDSAQLIIPQSQVGRKNGRCFRRCLVLVCLLIQSRHLHCRCFQCTQRLP
jgi:RAB protein geranylgeranyltransferase component A